MGNLTRKGRKGFRPRHATQSAEAANRQERAVEKRERQAAKAQIFDEILAKGQPPFHCTECDGSGYHTPDCPNRLPIHRKPDIFGT